MKYPESKDRHSQIYDQYALSRDGDDIAEWKAVERKKFLDYLISENKQTLLEIGCGHGRDSQYFAEHDLNVLCTDVSSKMIELCKNKRLSDMG